MPLGARQMIKICRVEGGKQNTKGACVQLEEHACLKLFKLEIIV